MPDLMQLSSGFSSLSDSLLLGLHLLEITPFEAGPCDDTVDVAVNIVNDATNTNQR